MHRTWFAVGCLAAVLALNGCGGRSARPVAATQSFDQQMSCAQIASEVESNKVRINSLHKEDADRHGRNAAMATAGVLLVGVGALFFIDTGEAQAEEIKAYNTRNANLTQLAAKNGCTEEEMAAAVAANSAGAAATATTGAASTAGTQVAAASPPSHQQAQLQAQFDAWYAANQEALRRALSAEVRAKGLAPADCAHPMPTALIAVQEVTVTGRDAQGYRANVAYVKQTATGACDESQHDNFLIRIENDSLKEVSYLGPAATSAPAAATSDSAPAAGIATGSSPASSAQTAKLPWAGTWQGETKLPSGQVAIMVVDGQVTTTVILPGMRREVSGPLDSKGAYTGNVAMQSGGPVTIEINGVFPTFTVGYATSFNREPNRTITVVAQ